MAQHHISSIQIVWSLSEMPIIEMNLIYLSSVPAHRFLILSKFPQLSSYPTAFVST